MSRPRLYGVLDCAIDATLFAHAQRLEPGRAACLYMGNLDSRVRAVSPFLVELEAQDALAVAWRTTGWEKNWGILISSSLDLQSLRRHLRHFTMARLPDGQGPVVFRFWDPRVFRVYLPLVEPAEIGAWFAQVEAFVLASEDGQGSVQFSLKDGVLTQTLGAHPGR